MKNGSNGEKAYLSAILTLKGRDIVFFAIGKSNNKQLVFEIFDLAIQKYSDAHPLFQSYRGFQYTSKQFRAKLDKQRMEHFFGHLKSEPLFLQEFDSVEHFKKELIDYIDYYNNWRIKERLRGLPPALHRQQALSAA